MISRQRCEKVSGQPLSAQEVEQAYTQAYTLCQQMGETSQLVPVLLGLWRFYVSRPQFHMARELGDTLLRLAQRTRDPALAVIAHTALGATWLSLGAVPAARSHLEAGNARYTPRPASYTGIPHGPGSGCCLDSMSLRHSGYWGTRSKPWPASTRP